MDLLMAGILVVIILVIIVQAFCKRNNHDNLERNLLLNNNAVNNPYDNDRYFIPYQPENHNVINQNPLINNS